MDTETTLPQSRLAVPDEVDESAFFTLPDGTPTLAGHADLEAAVPNEEKSQLEELERYWVNEPFAFVVIYQNVAQQEYRYHLVEPSLSETERGLVDFFGDKLKFSLDYDSVSVDATPEDRAEIVREETIRLMDRYNLLDNDGPTGGRTGVGGTMTDAVVGLLQRRARQRAVPEETVDPVPVERDPETGARQTLDDRQVEKIIYYLVRNFIRYDRIDGLKHDVNVEDISCDGYNEPIFVYHGTYGQVLTNVEFGRGELDEFVIKLAQRARKGISKRQPNVDATLADGSRAQLTLGREVSDRGTNFTIRQFREVPFTPVDLITWETYSLSQMVYLWLAVESGKSLVIAGGTASGKTTTLNALSLFIPSDSKIVSIEDTRELLIPQRNWVANTTRESFQADDGSDIDEFDLLEDSLRQRPDYIIMGEVRGEEGRTLFQAMNTGHTVCTTFHANSPKQVIRRFTQDPINVASSMFGAVDLVVNQTSTKVDGRRVRRATGVVEIDSYDAEAEEFVVDRTYDWDSVTDEIRANTAGRTDLMDQVRLDNGWSDEEFEREWRQRKLLLASLIDEGITSYAGVAAALQAYMHNPDVVMSLVDRGELGASLENLTTMRTIEIDIDDEVEALVPRPTPDEDLAAAVAEIVADGTDDGPGGVSAPPGGDQAFADFTSVSKANAQESTRHVTSQPGAESHLDRETGDASLHAKEQPPRQDSASGDAPSDRQRVASAEHSSAPTETTQSGHSPGRTGPAPADDRDRITDDADAHDLEGIDNPNQVTDPGPTQAGKRPPRSAPDVREQQTSNPETSSGSPDYTDNSDRSTSGGPAKQPSTEDESDGPRADETPAFDRSASHQSDRNRSEQIDFSLGIDQKPSADTEEE